MSKYYFVFLLQRYDFCSERHLLKSSKILVIFFQNTEFSDEMDGN